MKNSLEAYLSKSPNADDVRVTGTNKTVGSTAKHMLDVATGDLVASVDYDYISRSVVTNVETWTFKSGGAAGNTVLTIDITYTDATLETISTVEYS